MLAFVLLFLPVLAQASSCELSIDSTDQMRYSAAELTVPSGCETVTLTLTHSGSLPKTSMGHNWVLVETDQLNDLAKDAMAAGPANNYVPVGDDRVLAATELVGGGESTSVEFSVAELQGKDLSFFCSFPGHFALMKGKFIIE
ncbi:azurin [Nitrincola sp. A-D6]|uniref:azurin n=1 Tax=Nitrincola sp. A-D6 TaxID=1545442 RepID=UPI00051FF31A|nr:azurin [Nitrincola sp. A-D6]KGK42565.1 azurin [Nitrincola sp. A-D6]